MKKIMVDMDDVLTNSIFLDLVKEFLGYLPDFTNVGFHLQNALGNKKEAFFDWFKDKDMYQGATLLPGCYEALKELSNYYEIYICTDYIWPEIVKYAGNNLKNKYQYLYSKFDFINPENFIFAYHKEILNCEIKIDDRIKNIQNAETKLLFTAYHNKDLNKEELEKEGIIRVNSWKEIADLLLKDFK